MNPNNLASITSPFPLSQWQWIVVNTSGGKDSQTALRHIVAACDRENVDRSRIVASHQHLGRCEWPGTLQLVEQHARIYGIRLETSQYRNKAREQIDLLEYVRRRGKWPSAKQRFCTSEFKRGPGGRVLVRLGQERPGPILNIYGFRAVESTARAKKREFSFNRRFSSSSRMVFDWLPIHDMSLDEVWTDIRASGVPYHPAYDLGMPRLSCCFCIFAPKAALMIAGRANPALLDDYCDTEHAIGHTFQPDRPISAIRDAIRAGADVQPAGDEAWNM